MERPIKVNFTHQSKLDEINNKLQTDFEIIESYKQMWQNSITNHISRKERDELSEQLQEKLDKFHTDFIYAYNDLINDIVSQYLYTFKSKENLTRIENDLEYNLLNFIKFWKDKINSFKLLNILLDILPGEDLPKLRYCGYSFVEDNYNDEITINSGRCWRILLNTLGLKDMEISNYIDNKFNLNE